MKKTLLEMTQDILNDMDSDEINSIQDTIEGIQVAQIIRTTYEDIIGTRNWPHLKELIKLTASGDSARPTHMGTPENLKELEPTIRYNKVKFGETRKRYETVLYKQPEDFLNTLNGRDSDSADVDVISDYSGVELLIKNDLPPSFWTTFDDEFVVFDSYDSEVEATLQTSKTQAFGYVEASWTHEDSFIPDLPSEAFISLLSEAKSTAFVVLKQLVNSKAEQSATRNARRMSRKAWQTKGGIRTPNYGRGSVKSKGPILDKHQVVIN